MFGFDDFLSVKEYSRLVDKSSAKNEKVVRAASYGAMILSVIAFVTLCIVRPFSMITLLVAICVLNVVFDCFFAEKFVGEKGRKIFDIYCVAFLMAILPLQWFATGGFAGPGGLWLLFTAAYCMYSITGRAQVNLIILLGLEVIMIMGVSILRPDYVRDLLGTSRYVAGLVSTLGIGAYIQYIQLMQAKEFIKDREELQKFQEETARHFAETEAANASLLDTTRRLEQSIKTQRSFTASMNHELRAPLNGIEGCLQILLMDDTLSRESRETVENALTASKTINQTVNDLLDFAMLDEGKFEIVRKVIDIRDILDNISTIFRPQANAKNLKFQINIPRDTRVSIVGDGVRIQQIMTNLISNGIKYTHEGSVVMTVTTERGLLKFDVTDTGQGMTRDSVNTLFDPFTRFNLEENVNVQGTGLGMNIVSNLVKAMDGKIEVDSRLGRGTTFNVEIPIIFYDSEIIYSTPRATENTADQVVDLSGIRVLFVDDTEINRTVFRGLLKKTGAEVFVADSGKRAIKMCNEQHFDIIFMDHQMPELDGMETIKYIRNLKDISFKKVPVIMCTGNAGVEYREMYRKNGIEGYLLKPFMYEELIGCFKYLKL